MFPGFDGRGREVANRKRRGEDAVDERLDEVLDEDALAEDDELDLDEADIDEADLDEQLIDDEDEIDEERESRARRNGRSRTGTKPRPAAAVRKAGPAARRGVRAKDADRRGIIGRIINFVREVVAELRKVIWPTRKELLTYTTVVIFFVTIMFIIVATFDAGFAKAALWVFGNGKK